MVFGKLNYITKYPMRMRKIFALWQTIRNSLNKCIWLISHRQPQCDHGWVAIIDDMTNVGSPEHHWQGDPAGPGEDVNEFVDAISEGQQGGEDLRSDLRLASRIRAKLLPESHQATLRA